MQSTKPRGKTDILDLTGIDINNQESNEDIKKEMIDTLSKEIREVQQTAEKVTNMAQGEKKKKAIMLLNEIKESVEKTEGILSALSSNTILLPEMALKINNLEEEVKNNKKITLALIAITLLGFIVTMAILTIK